MMTRLFASALLVVGMSQGALAQMGTQQDHPSMSPQQTHPSMGSQQNQPSTSAENTQAPQSLPQSLRQRLTSAGFSEVPAS